MFLIISSFLWKLSCNLNFIESSVLFIVISQDNVFVGEFLKQLYLCRKETILGDSVFISKEKYHYKTKIFGMKTFLLYVYL